MSLDSQSQIEIYKHKVEKKKLKIASYQNCSLLLQDFIQSCNQSSYSNMPKLMIRAIRLNCRLNNPKKKVRFKKYLKIKFQQNFDCKLKNVLVLLKRCFLFFQK